MHTGFFKVFPRKSNMGTAYSGCQSLWLDKQNGKYKKYLTAYYESGTLRVVQHYEPEEQMCKYEMGKLVDGDPRCIDRPGFFPIRSVPGGCTEKALRTGEPPAECVDD
jgi:hypothetical protein